jgi:hypothetical protein
MATPSPEETAFIKSFSRFSLASSGQEAPLPTQKVAQPSFLKEFHLFSNLIPEIRDQIWDLTLPQKARVLHVRPIVPTTDPVEYVTSPISYGGKHPVALSVCQDSRAAALRKLTLKFKAYWDLEHDSLYVPVKKWGGEKAMEQVADMRKRGLLDDFRKLALDVDVWDTVVPEHWYVVFHFL